MRRAILVLALPLLLAACGKTAGDVIQENKAKIDAVRATLVSVLSALPPPGESISATGEAADPKPAYDAKEIGASPEGNVAFLTPEEIKDGSKPQFDLSLSSDLDLALAWTGPANPMSETALSGPENEVGKIFERALATPYAIVYRPVSYEPPVAEDEKNFSGGTLDLEAFLIRLSDGNALAACRIQAAADTEVSYSYKQGEDPKAALQDFADSTLHSDARKTLAQCLTEKTGGTFKL